MPSTAHSPALSAPHLAALTDALDLIVAESGDTLAVGVEHRSGHADLVLEVLHRHPTASLLGFRAPPEWDALGIASPGEAVRVAPSDSTTAPGTAVRVVHLVTRGGLTHSQVTSQDGRSLLPEADAAVGPIDDLCRRALGLITPPPETGTNDLWARLWLDRLVSTSDGAATEPTWTAAAAAHPAVGTIGDHSPDLRAVATDQVAMAGAVLARTYPWEELRRRCARGSWTVDHVPPDVAAWLDEGSFARTVLADLPELADLLDMVEGVLPTAITGRVVDTLAAWGLVTGPGDRPRPRS